MGAHFFWTSINFNGAVYLGYKPRDPTEPFLYVNGAQFGIVVKTMVTSMLGYMDYNFGGMTVLELEETN